MAISNTKNHAYMAVHRLFIAKTDGTLYRLYLADTSDVWLRISYTEWFSYITYTVSVEHMLVDYRCLLDLLSRVCPY